MKKYPVLLYIAVLILGIITVRDYFIRFGSKQNKTDTSSSSDTPKQNIPMAQISFPNIKVSAEIADTPEKRALGLSYRESMAENGGMLFVFENPNIPFFWMKDMGFPLDIVWIVNGTIVDIDKNVPIPKEGTPINQLPKYSPTEKIDYALEVNAGFTDKNNVEVGDEVSIVF